MASTNISLECREHSNKAIMCCATCNLLPLCSECIGEKSTHIGHTYCHIAEALKPTPVDLNQLIAYAKAKKIDKISDKTKKNLQQNTRHYDNILNTIRTRRAEISQVLDEVTRGFEKECETHRKSNSSVLQEFLQSIMKLPSDLTRMEWQCRDALEKHDEALIVKLKFKLQKFMEECNMSPPAVNPWEFSVEGSIEENLMTQLFLSGSSSKTNSANETESDTHRNRSDANQQSKNDSSDATGSVPSDDLTRTSDFLTFLDPSTEGNEDIKIVVDKHRHVYTFEGCGGAIENIIPLENDEMWILFRGSNTVLRINKAGTIKRQVRIGKHYTYINDIFCTPDFSTLYMCLGVDHSIKILEPKSQVKTLFHTEGEPVCFALSKANDLIIVTQDGSPYGGFFREVALFSTLGHSMNTFGKKRDRRNLFGFPSRIKVNRVTGDIAIINFRSVTVLSRHFKVKYRYNEDEENDENSDDDDSESGTDFNPRDICFDSKNNLLIANCANNSISVLDDAGRLRQVMKLSYRPESIGVGLEGELWVGYDCGKMQLVRYPVYL